MTGVLTDFSTPGNHNPKDEDVQVHNHKQPTPPDPTEADITGIMPEDPAPQWMLDKLMALYPGIYFIPHRTALEIGAKSMHSMLLHSMS